MATQGLLVPYLEFRVLCGLLFCLIFQKKPMKTTQVINPILIIAGGKAAAAITVACTCRELQG